MKPFNLRYTTAVAAALVALAACSPEQPVNTFKTGTGPAPKAEVVKQADGSETQRFCGYDPDGEKGPQDPIRMPEDDCKKLFAEKQQTQVVHSGGGDSGLMWFFVGHMLGNSNNYNPGYGQPMANTYGRSAARSYNYSSYSAPVRPSTYRTFTPATTPKFTSTPSRSFVGSPSPTGARAAVNTGTVRGIAGNTAARGMSASS